MYSYLYSILCIPIYIDAAQILAMSVVGEQHSISTYLYIAVYIYSILCIPIYL